MTTLIVIIVLLVLAIIIVPFARAVVKDKEELERESLDKKFYTIINQINNGIHNGRGEIVPLPDDPRQVNLFNEERQNMIINFVYTTGNLTVILKYKYYQRELIKEITFPDVRNADTFMQKDMGNQFVEMAKKEIEAHQKKVLEQMSGNVYSDSENVKSNAPDDEVLDSIYQELSKDEKKSIINFCYLVSTADGSSESEFIRNPILPQILGLHRLNWADCKKRLDQYGEDQMIADLKKLKQGSIDMLVMDVFYFTFNGNQPSEKKLIKYQQVFAKLDISEKELFETIQKAILINQMIMK